MFSIQSTILNREYRTYYRVAKTSRSSKNKTFLCQKKTLLYSRHSRAPILLFAPTSKLQYIQYHALLSREKRNFQIIIVLFWSDPYLNYSPFDIGLLLLLLRYNKTVRSQDLMDMYFRKICYEHLLPINQTRDFGVSSNCCQRAHKI